jgi:hypothetical protein
MKYQKLLCKNCKEKIRKEWKKEKKAYRLSIKVKVEQTSGVIKIKK